MSCMISVFRRSFDFPYRYSSEYGNGGISAVTTRGELIVKLPFFGKGQTPPASSCLFDVEGRTMETHFGGFILVV